MKSKNNKTKNEPRASWKTLFKFYRKVKIPWIWLILVFVMSFALKEVESQLVPYTTSIQTGAINSAGFLGGFIVMTIVYGITEALQGGVNELGSAVMTRNTRHTVWRKLIHLPMSVYNKEEPQRFVSRVTQDTAGAYAALTSIIQLASVLYGLYTNFIKMYRVYDVVSLIMLSAIPMTILTSYICGRLQFSMERITNAAFAAITNFFGERLPNLLHIKTSCMEDEEYIKGIKANEAKYKADVKRLNRFIFSGPIGTMAQYINQIILLIVASVMVRNGTMRMAQMLNLYNYFILFMGNAFMITAVWQNVKLSHGACSTIASLVEMEDEQLEGAPVGEEAKDIVFDHVSFAYEEGKDVLRDVSFVIPKGKVTAIVGENGSGKSTIIKLLEGFNKPKTGKILLGDAELEKLSLREWREEVGYLSQGNQVIKGTLRENICYGIENCTEEEIEEAAKLACAHEFIQTKEGKMDSLVSQFDSKLSGGELQRLAIARAILKKPQYLIMDEATSGIDVVSETEVLRGLNNVMKDKTVIMVSHDMNMINKADNIIVLNEGVIEACGNYEQVLENSELFGRLAAVN